MASQSIEHIVERLMNSPYCLLNSCSPIYLALSGACSLKDFFLCSAGLYALSSLQVSNDFFDSDHFPISISVNISSPFQSCINYFRWHCICHDFNAALPAYPDLDCNSLVTTAHMIMEKHKFSCSLSPATQEAFWPSGLPGV